MIKKWHNKVMTFLFILFFSVTILSINSGMEGLFNQTTIVANALTTKQISADKLETYSDGSLKSFSLSYYIDYYANFSARLIIMDKKLSHSGSVQYSSTEEEGSIALAAAEGANVVANGSSYQSATMNSRNAQIIYANQGDVAADGTMYYVYLWTLCGGKYYKDSDLGTLFYDTSSNIWKFNDGIKDIEVIEGIRYITTLNYNGGSDSTQTIYTTSSGDDNTLTFPSPVNGRFGYNFLGWSEASNAAAATYTAGQEIIPDSNKTYYAVWEKYGNILNCSAVKTVSEINVTPYIDYDSTSKYLVSSGDEVTLTSKTRLYFSSGSFTETLSDGIYTYVGKVSSDITVKTAYTVSFDTNGGTKVNDVLIAYGSYIYLSTYSSTKTCYAFNGWYKEKELTNHVTSSAIYSDVTYYASWEESHDWNYTYDWNEDKTKCRECRICKNDDSHTMIVIYTKHEAVPATCTEDGTIEYYSSDSDSGYYILTVENTFTAVDSITITASGHDWGGKPTYVWADDNSTCTKTYICQNNSSHKKVETVDTESITENGKITYTAKFQEEVTKYSHTSNINDAGIKTGDYENNQDTNEVITIEGAESLHVVLTYQTESTNYDWVSVWEGAHPEYTAKNDYSSGIKTNSNTTGKYGNSTQTTIEFDVAGDSVTFGFYSDNVVNGYYGYYAVVTGNISDIQIKSPYTITIPATAKLGNTVEISASEVNIVSGISLNVRLSDTGESNGSFMLRRSSKSISYKIIENGRIINKDDIILTVDGGTADSSKTEKLYFSEPLEATIPAGEYTGTLTFTITLE